MSRLWCGLWLFLAFAALAAGGAGTGSADAGTPRRAAAEPRAGRLAGAGRDGEALAAARRTGRAGLEPRPTADRCARVFYAATDYLRLATKLAANASPCAEYYISIPPLVADKTQPRPRPGLAHPRPRLRTSTPWPRSTSRPGSGGSRAPARAGTSPARPRARGWPRPATTSRRATRGWSTRSRSAVRQGHGHRPGQPPRVPPRPLRGRRHAADARSGLRHRASASGRATSRSTRRTSRTGCPTPRSGRTCRTYVSDWSQEVYGDVRSYAVPGASTSVRARLPERLPAAPARARRRRAADDRDGPLVPADGVQPARERGLGAGHRVRLDDGPGRADGGLRLRAGLRAPLLQRHDRAAAGPLGLRLGAEERVGRSPRRTSPPRPASILDRLGAAIRDSAADGRPERSGKRAPAGRRARTSGASATSTAPA